MHKLRTIILLSILFFYTTPYSCAKEYKYKGTMGYLVDGLNNVKYKDTRLALSMWIQDLASVGEGIETEINYYETVESILVEYQNFQVGSITLNPYFLLKYKDVLYANSKDFWTVKKNKYKFQKYYILVRADAEINSMKDLKEKTFVSRVDDYLGRLVFNYEALKNVHTLADRYLKPVEMTNKFSTAILKTYFGKVDACIVPSYALDIVGEMNPDILRKLVIFHESEKIFPIVLGAFHNNTHEVLIKRFSENAERLDKTVRGQSILNLFKMEQVVPLR